MNALPEHRRALNARTWSRAWSAADYDPISAHQATSSAVRAVLGGVAVVLVLLLAVHLIAGA